MQFKAVLIIGQTASGKTAVAHELCERLRTIPCEIVNLDAFQIYKGVSIGTAKPSVSDQIKYHYHGLDLCEPHETMDANVFAKFAQKICAEIFAKGHLPICVGGSGLYLRAFLHGLDAFPPHNPEIRSRIRDYANLHGWEKCYEWLTQVDPVRANELHPNDHVRIERALEIFEITKQPASSLQTKKETLFSQSTKFDSFVVQTVIDNDELKKNIEARTRELFERGWVAEVQTLFQRYGDETKNLNCMRAIGYKTILDFVSSRDLIAGPIEDHTQNLIPEKTIDQIMTETYQYAKRQKTWNKKEKVDFFIHPKYNDEINHLVEAVLKFARNVDTVSTAESF